MRLTVIGHNTILIEMAGQRMLTDPFFGTWGNPVYARLSPPALPREALQDVDLVLVSHTHWDHIDSDYLRGLPEEIPTLVPWQSGWEARLQGARRVQGMHPWQTFRRGEVAVTAVPALHWAFTLGYVIEGEGRSIYFAGDTFYIPAMQEIGRRFRIDVALIPVTTFRPPMTMGEKSAVRAIQAIRPRVVVPIHLAVQPRMPWLRTGHSVTGFERRIRAAGLDTPVMRLENGEAWDGLPAPEK